MDPFEERRAFKSKAGEQFGSARVDRRNAIQSAFRALDAAAGGSGFVEEEIFIRFCGAHFPA